MNTRSLIFLVLGTFSVAFAQSTAPTSQEAGFVVPLWPVGKMPGRGADGPETKTFKHNHTLSITNVSEPTLTVFKASGSARPVPSIIICPGGAYKALSYDLEGTEIAAWLNSLGITAVLLKYRVPKNRDGAFQDVQRAFRVVRAHASDWGIQPAKTGIMGFSAGGHLAAKLSTNFQESAYPEIDSADKLSCRPDFVILVYPAYLQDNGKLAPEMHITEAMPNTLIVHNADDLKYAPGSQIYDAALTSANIPHKFLFYSTGGHGYGLRSKQDVQAWPMQTKEWLHGIGIL